jgi:hypothetical protein
MSAVLSGPMFERDGDTFRSIFGKQGAHYNIYQIRGGIDALKQLFPDGEANDLNIVLFSTSGVHGSYTTIEEIEAGLKKYGDDFTGQEWPDDYPGNELTVLIVQPRIVCLRYGNITVRLADIPYLKKLRETSLAAVPKIGTR